MIGNLAELITDTLIKKKIIPLEEKEIYDYCFETAIVTLISLFCSMFLAIIFSEFLNTIAFLLSFSVFRRIGGGYHAKSYFKCSVLSLTCLLLFFILVKHSEEFIKYNYLILLVGLSVIMVFSPVADENKPIPERQRKRLKITTIVLGLLILFIFLILKLCSYESLIKNEFMFSICCGISLVAISLILKKTERRLKDV